MKKILVICHDAGGANILAALVKKYKKEFNWFYQVAGPAKKIFKNKKIKFINLDYSKNTNIFKDLMAIKPDLILTGTSWSSRLETIFIKAAKKKKITCACFLDHWYNYKERFGYPGSWKKNLPDYIFVGDRQAYTNAVKNNIPKRKILLVENPYFEAIFRKSLLSNKTKTKRQSNFLNILYLSQPVTTHGMLKYKDANHWGFSEHSILKDLIKIIKELKLIKKIKLKIRLHPSEKNNKYSSLESVSITNSHKNSLISDCFWADIVIGSASMALVTAIILGKKTISYIPGRTIEYPLPFKEIENIKSFEQLQKNIKNYIIITKKNRTNDTKFFNKGFLFSKAVNKILK